MMQIEVTRINVSYRPVDRTQQRRNCWNMSPLGPAALFDDIQLTDDITYAELTVLIRAEFPLLKTVIVAADFDYEW